MPNKHRKIAKGFIEALNGRNKVDLALHYETTLRMGVKGREKLKESQVGERTNIKEIVDVFCQHDNMICLHKFKKFFKKAKSQSVSVGKSDDFNPFHHIGGRIIIAGFASFLLSGCTQDEETDTGVDSPEEEVAIEEEQEEESVPEEDSEDNVENTETDEPEEDNRMDVPDAYGVSAGHPEAVEAGMEVLDNGGNAVDAAVAAAYAVSVVEPFASGIGGGGVTLVHEQGKEPQAYDYREVVPEDGIPASNIGVPGFVAGMVDLHTDHGNADWQELLDPAIALADSSEVSSLLAQQLESAAGRLPVDQLSHFYPNGMALGEGETVEQSELADTLRVLRDEGGEAFYEGEFSETLAAQVAGIDAESLSGYEVGRHDPVIGEFADYDIIGTAPPLPGANAIQMLQILEARGVAEKERDSAEYVHDLAMSWRLARQFLETDVGDPNFIDVPIDNLTDADRNASLAEEIPDDSLLSIDPGQSYGGIAPNTTHITVVDADGTVVSMTNTITNFWGAGEYVEGFFLNDQMARFSIGRGDVNEPEPGRRSITWSSPLIVADEDGPILGIGSPGGERIPLMLTQVVTHWTQGATLEEAVAAPRFHIEDDALIFEQQPDQQQQDQLLSLGYSELRDQPTPLYFGSVQALALDREAGELIGATDDRREGNWRIERAD